MYMYSLKSPVKSFKFYAVFITHIAYTCVKGVKIIAIYKINFGLIVYNRVIVYKHKISLRYM